MRSAILLCCLVEADRRRLAAYNYMEVAKLTAADAASWAHFGYSVAIDGDTVVVGTWFGEAAYVFRTSDGGATYGQVAKLTATDGAAYDYFGYSVAIDGATIVVGAYQDDDTATSSGSVYVFRTSDGGATYVEVAKLTASDAASWEYFGRSVAIDGATVVVGAIFGNNDKGATYVFHTTDGGATYGQVAKLTASDAAANDYFGRSVAIDGDTVLIGATGAGVYVFHTSDGGATYDEVAKLTAADTCCADNFGVSVAIDGDTIVVGASWGEAAYVFRTTDGASYGQVAKLTADDAASGDLFGISVAISKGTVVIGAYLDDDAGSNSGSAYVFSLPAPTAQPTTAQPTAQPTKQVDVLDPWEIALISIACLIFCVACYVFLRPSATAWTRTKAFGTAATAWTRTKALGAAAMAWMRTKAHGSAATAAKISPAAPPAAETPPMLRTTSLLPMGTVEAVRAPDDAPSTPPILGEVVTHSTVLSVSN